VQLIGRASFCRKPIPGAPFSVSDPTSHKFLVLPHLPLQTATQVPYRDGDTFFFDDIDLVFDLHGGQDWYAREEFMSRRSRPRI